MLYTMGLCGGTYNLQRCFAIAAEPLDADPDIVEPGVRRS